LRVVGISPDKAAPAAASLGMGWGAEKKVRAQGVHPESLLALFAASPANIWIKHDVTVAGMAAAPPETSAKGLDTLIKNYFDELKEAPTTGIACAELESLKGATIKMALAFWSAHPKRGIPGPAALDFGGKAEYFRAFFRVAADFVTPGDLLKCTSLYKVGCL